MLTAVCVSPSHEPLKSAGPIVLDPVDTGESAIGRAGFLPGLRRFVDTPGNSRGYYLVIDEGNGYLSSNAFFQLESDDEPARLMVPDVLREPFEHALEELLRASGERRIVLVAEDNGHVTDPDLSAEEIETIDTIGPIDLPAFLRRLDLKEIYEDSVIEIVG